MFEVFLRHNYAMQVLIPYIVVMFIYLAVAADFWRGAKTPNNTYSLKLHSAMIALGLVVHSWLLYQNIFKDGFNLGFFNALSAIFWLTVLIYWIADLKHKLTSLQAFVLPPAAIFALLPAFHINDRFLPVDESALFLTHITIALLAYSLFTFAPLMIMETLLFRVIGLGFALLTVTELSGILFSEQIFSKPMQLNHKTIFSIASWFIYAGLLFGRYRYGWRGVKAIRWTLAGFVLLLLAYVGSKFILEVLLHR